MPRRLTWTCVSMLILALLGNSGNVLAGVDIAWPDGTQPDISEYQDDFAPYGDLADGPLLAVTMTNEDTDEVYYPLYQYGDDVILFYWTAQFDYLPSGTYSLTVYGYNCSQTMPGLVIE